MMTIATKTIHGAEAIEHAIKKAAPDGLPSSDPDHILSDWHIGEALNADKRNAIRVISSAVEKLPSAGKRIAREIEKELSEL